MLTARLALFTIGILAVSTWVGSLACLALVSAASRKTLESASRIALFRALGRTYGIVGTSALVIAIGAGLSLAWPPSDMSGTLGTMFLLSALLILATALGMAQARSMTVTRRRLLDAPTDLDTSRAVQQGARLASVLRGTMGLVTLTIVVLGARLLDQLS
jgi:hypothetical protein